jgi:large subunit ribosomal protein L29
MRGLKMTDLRQQTVEELRDKERELAEQLFALRLQKATGQLENPARLPYLRRDLARVLTILSEKRLQARGE